MRQSWSPRHFRELTKPFHSPCFILAMEGAPVGVRKPATYKTPVMPCDYAMRGANKGDVTKAFREGGRNGRRCGRRHDSLAFGTPLRKGQKAGVFPNRVFRPNVRTIPKPRPYSCRRWAPTPPSVQGPEALPPVGFPLLTTHGTSENSASLSRQAENGQESSRIGKNAGSRQQGRP